MLITFFIVGFSLICVVSAVFACVALMRRDYFACGAFIFAAVVSFLGATMPFTT